MNLADIIVILAVAALIVFALFIMHHNSKNGKLPCGCDAGSCSGNCVICSQSSTCRRQKKNDK